jgi:hypothetical protein
MILLLYQSTRENNEFLDSELTAFEYLEVCLAKYKISMSGFGGAICTTYRDDILLLLYSSYT